MDTSFLDSEEEIKNKMEKTKSEQEAKLLNRQITVAELIKQLSEIDGNMLVDVEGCDCIGEANGILLDDDTVLITRL